jgi:hypothetical protein
LLAFSERLLVVSVVCKGWRALRREPCLWRSLSLCAPAFSGAGALAFASCVPRSPLAAAAHVARLVLHGGAAFDAKAFKAVLKQLSHASDVSLSGKKLSADALTLLASPAAPRRWRASPSASAPPAPQPRCWTCCVSLPRCAISRATSRSTRRGSTPRPRAAARRATAAAAC